MLPSSPRRSALAGMLLVLVTALAAPQALAEPTDTGPGSADCAARQGPPKAVDTSEVPKPGRPSPTPLPVPKTPAGGQRMAECGYVLPSGAPKLPRDLGFASWMLTDLESGAVLAANDPHGRQRPASIIKTLLALVVLRDLDMDATVTATQQDANAEGTRVGIVDGGRYTVRQLLTSLLLKSGNDVAHALAVQLGGPARAVAKMNALARSLGARDTRAATPSGLDGPGMSTSAYDMALIFRTAMSDQRFARIVHTQRTTLPGTPGKTEAFEVANDNRLLDSYPGDLGGKTGFTDDAQHTFLNAASRDGHRVGLVMLRGTNHLEGMYRNARSLLDYGFALAGAGSKPVGTLRGAAPEPTPAPTASPAANAAPQAGATSDTGSGGASPALITGLAVVVLLLVGACVAVRRRQRG